jgi:two-component system OmpR family sensor kinase
MLVAAWAVFACVNLWLMFLLPGRETIPFHLIWFSLALVYGLVRWRLATMVIALTAVTVATFIALRHHATAGYIGQEELAEVPLMAAIFLAMVWHVRRRQAALAQTEWLAAVDRDRAEAEQMFVRLMSHEMRTPITVARGYAELIRTASPNRQTEEDAVLVLDELTKLDRSTQRLATLIALESAADVRLVDVDRLLQHVARRWMPTADRRWRVSSTAGEAVLDDERLQTALDCLLENAVNFTTEGDSIRMSGRREPDQVVIEVTDSGEGIPPDDMPYVFDNFHRGANSTSRDSTGLGLSIVRRAVEARGGTVAVASEFGSGATFTLRLPLSGQRPAGRPPQRSVNGVVPRERHTASPAG